MASTTSSSAVSARTSGAATAVCNRRPSLLSCSRAHACTARGAASSCAADDSSAWAARRSLSVRAKTTPTARKRRCGGTARRQSTKCSKCVGMASPAPSEKGLTAACTAAGAYRRAVRANLQDGDGKYIGRRGLVGGGGGRPRRRVGIGGSGAGSAARAWRGRGRLKRVASAASEPQRRPNRGAAAARRRRRPTPCASRMPSKCTRWPHPARRGCAPGSGRPRPGARGRGRARRRAGVCCSASCTVRRSSSRTWGRWDIAPARARVRVASWRAAAVGEGGGGRRGRRHVVARGGVPRVLTRGDGPRVCAGWGDALRSPRPLPKIGPAPPGLVPTAGWSARGRAPSAAPRRPARPTRARTRRRPFGTATGPPRPSS
eukprot:1991727-Prymnesium_polylepis.1